MKEKATSFDIAHLAGVSQSTVSRALRNSPLVNQETRDKIISIAQSLNYKVDKNASNLRQKQSRTIALLLFEDPTTDDSMINPFFLSMLGAITKATAAAGYDLLVSFQQFSEDWHADYEDTNKADGLILLGYGDYQNHQDMLKQLAEQGTHYIRWGVVDTGPGISVGCDNFQGGYQVTEHLVRLGRKRFAFIGGADQHCPEFLDRYLGHCKALADAGLGTDDTLQFDAITTEESGFDAVLRLLASGEKVDALVCASDLIAMGAIGALQESGYQVPADICVVGFDNIPVSGYSNPPLTTVRQNTKLAGELLVNSLISLIHDEDVKTHLLPAELVIRRSCGSMEKVQ